MYRYFKHLLNCWSKLSVTTAVLRTDSVRWPQFECGIRKKFFPDPGDKKHRIPDPDPQQCFLHYLSHLFTRDAPDIRPDNPAFFYIPYLAGYGTRLSCRISGQISTRYRYPVHPYYLRTGTASSVMYLTLLKESHFLGTELFRILLSLYWYPVPVLYVNQDIEYRTGTVPI
jgi:hypothetical protein